MLLADQDLGELPHETLCLLYFVSPKNLFGRVFFGGPAKMAVFFWFPFKTPTKRVP